MSKIRHQKRLWGIIIAIALLFIVLIISIFHIQQRQLHDQFDSLVIENLNTHTLGQRRQIHGIIIDASNTLTGIADLIGSSELTADGPWLRDYLEQISSRNPAYQTEYLTIDQFTATYNTANSTENINAEDLTSGQAVISDIHYSERQGGEYIFSIAVPVSDDGQMQGILRTRINISLFSQLTQQPAIFKNISTLITNENGDILYSNAPTEYEAMNTGNLFTSMAGNIADETISDIKRRYQTGETMTLNFEDSGEDYFLSIDTLDYNNWSIVNFVRTPDILIQSNVILKNVVNTGILLILLTAVISIIIITMLLRQKHRLDLEQERYLVLSQFTDTVLFEYDCRKDRLVFTPNAIHTLCLEHPQMEHFSRDSVHGLLIHPDDWAQLNTMLHRGPGAGSMDDGIGYMENRLKARDGTYDWYGCQYRYIPEDSATPVKVVGKLVDISDHVAREQELLEKSRKDILTDTYNKSGEDIIRKQLKENPVGILFMLDLDHFKNINDTYGHAAGDQLLLATGNILNHIFRTGDVVARLGGDEFVIFLPRITSLDVARKKARLILLKLSRQNLPELEGAQITASIGIALAPNNGTTFEALYTAADKAMYTAKNKYKHQGGYYICK